MKKTLHVELWKLSDVYRRLDSKGWRVIRTKPWPGRAGFILTVERVDGLMDSPVEGLNRPR
jgi:hypothetical protein